jgi:hypothetical protein
MGKRGDDEQGDGGERFHAAKANAARRTMAL